MHAEAVGHLLKSEAHGQPADITKPMNLFTPTLPTHFYVYTETTSLTNNALMTWNRQQNLLDITI